MLDLNAQIASRDGDLAPAGSGPTSALGFQLQGPSSLVCLGPQQNTGRTPFTSSLGLEGAAGHRNIEPSAPISFSNDIATSLHVNPTFEKHPEANVGIISNALDPKKHTAVTFYEKPTIKSISKMRSNSHIILKRHGIENRKGNGHNGKASFKSICGRGGKFKPSSSSRVSLHKLWALWQSSLLCKLEFLQRNPMSLLTLSEFLIAITRSVLFLFYSFYEFYYFLLELLRLY